MGAAAPPESGSGHDKEVRTVSLREIIRIDEEKCDGCGQCATACAEGAIQIVDGKAKLVSETYCDGLGACIGECPQDAITMEDREAADFDQAAVEKHLAAAAQPARAVPSCPSCQVVDFGVTDETPDRALADTPSAPAGAPVASAPSALRQWPVQIHLVPPTAPYLKNADLLIAADCVPFAYAGFHQDLLAGKALLIGCPKLDDLDIYVAKLTDVFRLNGIRRVTVARMEVGCCGGLVYAVQQALKASGKEIPFDEVVVGVRGDKTVRTPAAVS